MRRIAAVAAITVFSLASCSTEDAFVQEEAKSLKQESHDPSQTTFTGLVWTQQLDMDFSRLFEYSDTNELQRLSDEKFTFTITDMRNELESRAEATDAVSTIEIENGMARVKQLLFINSNNRNSIVERVWFKPGSTTNIYKEADGFYNLNPDFTLLSNDADNNIETIGQYLQQNLVNNTDKVTLEIKVNNKEAAVYTKKV